MKVSLIAVNYYEYALYETLWNVFSIVTSHGIRDYDIKVWNQSENVYRNYKTYIANMHLAKISIQHER